jgi:hypothetical protein
MACVQNIYKSLSEQEYVKALMPCQQDGQYIVQNITISK